MDAQTLHEAIAAVCPITGVSIGKTNDRTTWKFQPTSEATQPQIDAGANVINTIPDTTVIPFALEPAEFIRKFTDPEYLLLKQKHAADLTASNVTDIRNWDIMLGSTGLPMHSSNAQAFKASLVSGGILTQARADEIFAPPPDTRAVPKEA